VQELWTEFLQQGEKSGYIFTVAREGDDVLGYACFGPVPLTAGVYDLYWIAVDPAARGNGIGRALMEQMEAEVKARGGRLILIETSGTLPYAPTRRFYESCGYRYQAVIHDFYAIGDDLITYGKVLVPATT